MYLLDLVFMYHALTCKTYIYLIRKLSLQLVFTWCN